jgi:hypothetical protein
MVNSKTLAIMQPYFLPYIGYWQLMKYVDEFVVYDDIQFTKKGWIHRNRYLSNGKDQTFSLPLKKDSDFLNVVDRKLAGTWDGERDKLLRKIEGAYRKAPYFSEIMPVFEESITSKSHNLFEFIYDSLIVLKKELNIDTPIIESSKVSDSHKFRGKERVLDLCASRSADRYVNPIGGIDLYSKSDFRRNGVDLFFLSSDNIKYRQFGEEFFPNLSIIDVLMFNGKEQTGLLLDKFSLI